MSAPSVVIAAFTEEEAARLGRVSLRQLRYWAQDGFFVPAIDPTPPLRLYSFRDLVCLRILGSLRNELKVPLSHLRDVKASLQHLGEHLWSSTVLHVLDRRVVVVNPETGGREDAVNGQSVLQIPLQVVTADMQQAVRDLRSRPAADIGRLDTRVKARAVIAGTRIPVRAIQDFAAAGYDAQAILRQYPTLTAEDIAAALAHPMAA